jgi:DNA (cytosine-5)-methyltransferase 1
MSWLYSQALGEAYLGENFSDGEQSAPLNGNPIQQAYCAPDKMTGFSRLSRFGMTFKPLTESRGEELLTLYLEGFHAKTLVPQEKAQESMESEAECGEKWRASFTKYDLNSCLWKTHQCSLLGDLDEFLETWPQWGLMRDGECWEQIPLVRLIDETEFGLQPNNENFFHTPNTTGLDGESNSRKALRKRLMPTPVCQDSRHAQTRHLNPDCKHWESNLGEVFVAETGIPKMPASFVESMMGWPLGWTDLKPLVTVKFPYAPQQLGES